MEGRNMADFKPITESYWVEPGRLLAGEHPGHWDENVMRRRVCGLLDAGITLFIDLTAPEDGAGAYQGLLEKVSRERGIYAEYLSVPLPEETVPDHVEDMVYALSEIQFALESGLRVYVHCTDGVGRTGMVIGCWLVERGFDPEDALDELARRFAAMNKARFHHGTPSSALQAEWVENWEPMLSMREECSEAS
jgi:hypothetical protein